MLHDTGNENGSPLPSRDDDDNGSEPIIIPRASAEVGNEYVHNPWSPYPDYSKGWRRFGPKEPKAVMASLLLHGSIIAAFLVSFDQVIPPKIERNEMNVFEIAFEEGDGLEVRMPVASIEAEVDQEEIEEPIEEPVEEPTPVSKSNMPDEQVKPPEPQEASSTQGEISDTSSPDMTPGGGQMIWTPPAPSPNASGVGAATSGAVEERVVMPVVEMPKGASEPVLLSYDQARYTDATTMSEASRLLNTGMIVMAVGVDDKGVVTSCVVTTTSGSSRLDEKGCALIASYRYRPAQDAKGKPYASIVSEVLEWAKDGKFNEASSEDVGLEAIRNPEGIVSQPAQRRPISKVRMPGQD